MNDAERYKALLILTIWQIVERYGEDGNILLLGALKDEPGKIQIGWNTVGDDVIVTALEEKDASPQE